MPPKLWWWSAAIRLEDGEIHPIGEIDNHPRGILVAQLKMHAGVGAMPEA